MSSMVVTSSHSMAHASSPELLASLLSQLSQELLDAARLPSSGAMDIAEQDSQEGTSSILLRLLEAQQKAAELYRTEESQALGWQQMQHAVTQRQSVLDTLMARLEGVATGLSDSIDRNTPAKVPERCREAPSVAGVERILALAHRLSYTSFAPPGFMPGVTPLGVFRPPAPQEGQMQAAQLHQFAAEYEQAELRRQGQLPSAVAEQPALQAAPELTPALLASIPRMPPGWKPGDPLPDQQPPMLPDLKAGGTPATAAASAPVAATGAGAAAADPTAAAEQQAGPAKKPQRPVLDASFLVLNPDLEEAVEEDYSSEESSDSD